ncbi:MAG: hypothetical protein HYX80_04235 [Chloroflexi bacterium]|nr:hypothetical protein [Chloroflexota bacterium]
MPAKKDKTASLKTQDATFTCKFCEKSKSLSEMTVITRFFPVTVACRECAKKLG